MQKSPFLLEIGTEELPPKQLGKIAAAFADGFKQALKANDLSYDNVEIFASPRRIALLIDKLQYEQESKTLEIQGPPVAQAFDENGNAKPAAIGFAKKLGLTVEELSKVETPKGERLAATQKQVGKKLPELLENMCADAFKGLPQQRWMHWADKDWSFIRPVHWIIALYEREIIPFTLFGIESSNISRGHRFLSKGPITIPHASDYAQEMKNNFVEASLEQRKLSIKQQVAELEQTVGATAIFDEDLLEEATNLVEWPQVLVGEFKKEFLSVPKEALISSMQSHQKSFPLADKQGNLTNQFVIISNMQIPDAKNIIEGNQRVINARLSDAAFFYNQDKKSSLQDKAEDLKNMVFFDGLGTIFDKTERISKLSTSLAKYTQANPSSASEAAKLAKADLASEMVYEFPELQGIMGKYYAAHDGLDQSVATAIEEHYLPKSASDATPSTKEGATVALADRLDSLCGLFLIGKEPLKDKDPFALRRQALGVARILIDGEIDVDLQDLIEISLALFKEDANKSDIINRLSAFTFERIKAFYRQNGVQPQVIEATLNEQSQNPYDFSQRLEAIVSFAASEQSASLAEANKRVKNILAKNNIEAKNLEKIDSSLVKEEEEKSLLATLELLQETIPQLSKEKEYASVMLELSKCKDVVDNFFEKVMVMAEDDKVRENRIKMLINMRILFSTVGDISLI